VFSTNFLKTLKNANQFKCLPQFETKTMTMRKSSFDIPIAFLLGYIIIIMQRMRGSPQLVPKFCVRINPVPAYEKQNYFTAAYASRSERVNNIFEAKLSTNMIKLT
jgi:hypothetical protein